MIDGLYTLAERAYAGTSFSPERRAKDTVAWIEEMLDEDLAIIQKESGSTGNYREKFIGHAKGWLNAKSRCMSTMITGGSNFPVARNRKNMGYEHSAYENWMNWRARYIKAVFRKPTPSPEEDLDDALAKYEKLAQLQESMKQINKIVRKKGSTDAEKIDALVYLGYDKYHVAELIKPDQWGYCGFESYRLTNNNANMKRLKDKVMTMKLRIARKETFEPIRFEGGSISIENDRVIIKHDEKPEKSVIDTLKSHGFRWSPNYCAWSRKHTGNAIFAAKQIVGIK